MSAGNQSGSRQPGPDDNKTPKLQPEGAEREGFLEVVWSSPVSTGTPFKTGRDADIEKPSVDDDPPAWSERYVFAFESDLLDNAFVHWNHDEPTLEMIPGFKPDASSEETDIYPAETLYSGQRIMLPDSTDGPITQVDISGRNAAPDTGARPVQPDLSIGSPGPMRIREDGVEDPIHGWRPTGMVFFETLATPPRGTIYSSSLLDAFKNSNTAADSSPIYSMMPADTTTPGESVPFFDFPETVAPAPPDETEDFPLEEVVVKGSGAGGGGGIHLFRLMGRMLLLALALMGIGLVILGAGYVNYVKQRIYDGKEDGRAITVTIRPGQNFRSVIDEMKKQGLLGGFLGLDDRYLMRYLAYAYENSNKVKPGVYMFHSGQNLQDVYDKLIAGSKDFKITIPEGKTASEVAEIVAGQYKNFDADHFMQLVHDPRFIAARGINAPSLEGYLYPSTYYFGPGMKEEELAKLMVATFKDKVESISDKMTSTGLSFQEHVIMASLIEREARLDEDRPLIASVIYNRLRKGIPLQIDATVNFALDDWRRLNNSDYQTSHPYNTYKIKGLPPGPIASPRIESLLATFQAPETDYLFYVHKGDGHHAFAETYAQHQANVGRYIREKNASGMGNAPNADIPPTDETSENETSEIDEKQPALAGNGDSDTEVEPLEKAETASSDKSDKSEKPAENKPETAAPKSY